MRRHGGELSGVENHIIRLAEIEQFFRGGPDKHVVHEQGMVRPGTDHADLDPTLGIPAAEAVNDVNLATGVEIVDRSLPIEKKRAFVDLDIDRSPPDIFRAGRGTHDPFIFGTAARFFPGTGRKGPARIDYGGLADDGVFIEPARGRIAENAGYIDSMCSKVDSVAHSSTTRGESGLRLDGRL